MRPRATDRIGIQSTAFPLCENGGNPVRTYSGTVNQLILLARTHIGPAIRYVRDSMETSDSGVFSAITGLSSRVVQGIC